MAPTPCITAKQTSTSLLIKPILRSIGHFKRRRHALASLRWLSTRSVQAIHFFKNLALRRSLLIQPQPRHRTIAGIVRAHHGSRRRRCGITFLESAVAVAVRAGVEVEERCRGVFEVVVAGHALVDGRVGVFRCGDGEVQCDGADSREELGHVGCEAGDVEECGNGASGDGDGGAVAEVAGVVLVAAADGDVT